MTKEEYDQAMQEVLNATGQGGNAIGSNAIGSNASLGAFDYLIRN